ncbi:hypothetical protein C8R44DRAFT_881264 [Mycena epipterygia]|nr:hypothetical protein C8R44DRAFT_881264 [Mycena epipterygia]
MARLSFIVLAALLSTIVAATDLAACGDAMYDPSKDTCFDNDFLCPIDGQVRELSCGDACYSLDQFSCSNTTLVDNAVLVQTRCSTAVIKGSTQLIMSATTETSCAHSSASMAYHAVSLALRLAVLLSGALMRVTIPSSSGSP